MQNYIIFSTPEGAHLGYNSLIGIGSVFFPECSSKYFFFVPVLHLSAHTHKNTKVISTHNRSMPHTRMCICVCITKIRDVVYCMLFVLIWLFNS